jgi:hypothetical protein
MHCLYATNVFIKEKLLIAQVERTRSFEQSQGTASPSTLKAQNK